MSSSVLDTVMRLAARHHAAGRLREAAAIYRQALQRNPRHAVALHALGVMAYETGRFSVAEKLLLRAVDADPVWSAGHDDLASLRLAVGRSAEALEGYRRAIELAPDDPFPYAHLGLALARMGQFEAATAAYQRAAETGLLNRRRRRASIHPGDPFATNATLAPPGPQEDRSVHWTGAAEPTGQTTWVPPPTELPRSIEPGSIQPNFAAQPVTPPAIASSVDVDLPPTVSDEPSLISAPSSGLAGAAIVGASAEAPVFAIPDREPVVPVRLPAGTEQPQMPSVRVAAAAQSVVARMISDVGIPGAGMFEPSIGVADRSVFNISADGGDRTNLAMLSRRDPMATWAMAAGSTDLPPRLPQMAEASPAWPQHEPQLPDPPGPPEPLSPMEDRAIWVEPIPPSPSPGWEEQMSVRPGDHVDGFVDPSAGLVDDDPAARLTLAGGQFAFGLLDEPANYPIVEPELGDPSRDAPWAAQASMTATDPASPVKVPEAQSPAETESSSVDGSWAETSAEPTPSIDVATWSTTPGTDVSTPATTLDAAGILEAMTASPLDLPETPIAAIDAFAIASPTSTAGEVTVALPRELGTAGTNAGAEMGTLTASSTESGSVRRSSDTSALQARPDDESAGKRSASGPANQDLESIPPASPSVAKGPSTPVANRPRARVLPVAARPANAPGQRPATPGVPIVGKSAGGTADPAAPKVGAALIAPLPGTDPMVATRMLARQIRRARRAPPASAQQAADLNKEGASHLRQRRVEEAIAALQRLVELHPASAKAHRDLGAAYLRADRLDEAQASLVRAIELRPRFADAFASIGDVFHFQGKVDEAVACYRKALQLKPSASKTHSNLLLTLNYHRKIDNASLFAEHQKWAKMHADPLAASIQPHTNDPWPDRPLRVGYVSPDFRRHAVNFFLDPLLVSRDRSQFHITCYSDVIRPDDVTDRIITLCDRWRDIRTLSDEQVAEMVRADGIDILVDLAGHTSTNRLCVFARKPAPVQITYLGYPNTTGLSAIDYRLSDAVADPAGKTEAFHSERLVRLPSFLCYQPPADAPEPADPPSLKNGLVTFGCFNVLSKVTPETMGLWAKLMTVVPNSRLVMKDRMGTLSHPARRRYVQDIFAYHRVAADRIDLLGKEPDFTDHLEAYSKVDIVLDPFPYNGTTTTCEALWMGVPVVTLAGNRHAARVGASILTAAGLPELIATTPEGYARTAVLLARDADKLAQLRKSLRQRLTKSPLMDARRFTASIEKAYRIVWKRWCDTRDSTPVQAAGTMSLSDERA